MSIKIAEKKNIEGLDPANLIRKKNYSTYENMLRRIQYPYSRHGEWSSVQSLA